MGGDYISLWDQAPENTLKNLHKNVLQYYYNILSTILIIPRKILFLLAILQDSVTKVIFHKIMFYSMFQEKGTMEIEVGLPQI